MSVTSAQIVNSIPIINNVPTRWFPDSAYAGLCIAVKPLTKDQTATKNISPPLINSNIDETLRTFLLSDIPIFKILPFIMFGFYIFKPPRLYLFGTCLF